MILAAFGLTDFIATMFGTGWYAQLWLGSIIVDFVVTSTRTRIEEMRDLKWLLDAAVILGLVWLLLSLTGHPIRNVFG
jgi:hypothetical protein